MACSLIERLNGLSDKSPDEIARLLHNPWKPLAGPRDTDWYMSNRDRLVFLYNASGEYYHEYASYPGNGGPMRHWGPGVWTQHTGTSWFWCFADEMVPFVKGTHDVI